MGIVGALELATFRKGASPISTASDVPGGAEFGLIDIPKVMDSLGFGVGAALMRQWFAAPAKAMTEKEKLDRSVDWADSHSVDMSTVSMQWTLQFERAKKVRDAMMSGMRARSQPYYNNLLQKILRSALFGTRKLWRREFSVRLFNDIFFSNGTVDSSIFDSIDDMYAALGSFNIHMGAFGSIKQLYANGTSTQRYQVILDGLGFCVKDTYEFIGEQPLGYWNSKGAYKMPGDGRFAVENSSFREWRQKHNRGGDFRIYSDVAWVPQFPSIEFTFLH